jgi:hypothetical protein
MRLRRTRAAAGRRSSSPPLRSRVSSDPSSVVRRGRSRARIQRCAISTPPSTFALSRGLPPVAQCRLLHWHVELGIAIGGLKADVAEPRSNDVDLDPGFQQVHCRRVAKDVRAHAASVKAGSLLQRSGMTPRQFVDAGPGEGAVTPRDEDRALGGHGAASEESARAVRRLRPAGIHLTSNDDAAMTRQHAARWRWRWRWLDECSHTGYIMRAGCGSGFCRR